MTTISKKAPAKKSRVGVSARSNSKTATSKRSSSKRTVARSSSTGKVLHVVPQAGQWAIKNASKPKSTRVYDTQIEAIKAATRSARNSHSEVIIHGRTGRISQRVSISRADEMLLGFLEKTHKDRLKSKRG